MASRGFLARIGYTETELDPPIQAEILVESSRTEARISILLIIVALGFGVWHGMGSQVFRNIAVFCLIGVVPMLVDAALRRRAATKLLGVGPQPAHGPGAR